MSLAYNPRAVPSLQVHLDWKGYYKQFEEKHGEPVQLLDRDGKPLRLLFADGWTYSCTDYAGPEWPPPKNEQDRARLIAEYYKIKFGLVRNEYIDLCRLISYLRDLQSAKDVPLQQIASYFDDEQNKRVIGRFEVELTPLIERREWLRKAISECEQRLTEIGQTEWLRQTAPLPAE